MAGTLTQVITSKPSTEYGKNRILLTIKPYQNMPMGIVKA